MIAEYFEPTYGSGPRVGEEYSVALGAHSRVEVVTNRGTYGATMTGSVGYGFCSDKSEPCPFYLGSLEAVASSAVFVTAKCNDGKTVHFSLDDLVVRLGQPAFGIADATSDLKAFPAAGIMMDASFSVERERYSVRRPNRLPVTVEARDETFTASGLETTAEVPCGINSRTSITIRLSLEDPGDGSALGRPPELSMMTPETVSCGTAIQLTVSASDRDGDLTAVRWFVDDVLVAPTATTMTISASHELKAVAYDARGAATKDTKVISCL